MGKGEKSKPYKIIGAYDSETANLSDGAEKDAYPILHQLGTISVPIETITSDNVEQSTRLDLFRHTLDLYNALEDIVILRYGYVLQSVI